MSNVKKFMLYAKQQTNKYGIRIVLKKDYHIKSDGMVMDGYFDNKKIVCAVLNPNWLETFVHEFSHFQQWIDNPNDKREHYFDKIELWLQNKLELTKKQIKRYMKYIRYIELDCEKRAVNNIIKFKLPINVNKYIKQANAYIFAHLIIERHRVSYVNQVAAWKKMPHHFENNYDRIPYGTSKCFSF